MLVKEYIDPLDRRSVMAYAIECCKHEIRLK